MQWDPDYPKYFGIESGLVDLGDLSNWIVHEDESLLVVNKPGWLVCHPSKRGPLSSLVSACREHCGIKELHLINRLDRETSGLVLIAKTRDTAKKYRRAFEVEPVEKIYLAVLNGVLEESIIVDKGLADDEFSEVAIKQAVSSAANAKQSKTEFIPLENNGSLTLAKVILHSGRKHQIRAHAQSINLNIYGDKIYGPNEALYLEFIKQGWTEQLEKELTFPRQALHSWKINVCDQKYTAALHRDMQTLVEREFSLSLNKIGL